MIPASLKAVGVGAFKYCSALSEIVLPEGVEAIGSYAFSGCSSLTSFDMPNSVTDLGFSDCIFETANLTNVKLSENLIDLGNRAFEGSGVTELTIPATVDGVQNHISGSLEGADCLQTLTVLSLTPPYIAALPASVTKIYVSAESLELYKTSDEGWSKYADIIFAIPE